jgi:large subunit ribosomal protein L3
MRQDMGILGKKIGMTRVFDEFGSAVPVTVIEAGPCKVLQKKTVATDGYNAIQLGFGEKKEEKVTKPQVGHFRQSGGQAYYFVREFRIPNAVSFEVGQVFSLADVVKIGGTVHVQGVSKGAGFQGVVKRHGFKGGRATHGSMFHRAPGSIGCSAYPSRVIKGKKLPGHMGCETIFKKNIKVVDVHHDTNVVLLKGSVPGKKNSLLKIFAQ